MYIYKLDMSFETEDNDIAWTVDYVRHENQFSNEEFKDICKKALGRCEDSTMYDLKKALIEDGFANIESVASFEFTEE